MSTPSILEIEKTLRALLDGLRNAHLAIARGDGSSAIAYADEADRAANRLDVLVRANPEHQMAAARLFIDILAGGIAALKALLQEGKRAGPDEITAFLLRPLPATLSLARDAK